MAFPIRSAASNTSAGRRSRCNGHSLGGQRTVGVYLVPGVTLLSALTVDAARGEPVLVCTAWPYANGSLHVGHLAGVYVPADVFARYLRLRGFDVLMVSGTDAHGTPVTVRADQEGVSPAEVAARYHNEFLTYWRDLGITYDLYTTTTTDNHREVVQDEFMMLLDKGYLYKDRSVGFYDTVAQRFLPDTYIEGECPHCHYARARGNQCENCGRLLEPEDLIQPHSRLNPTAVLERRETEHFYLDLPAFTEPLTRWIETQSHWRPNVRNFSLNYIANLKPRAITRDIDWGVPIPLPDWQDRPDKRMYVWFDALGNYITALGYADDAPLYQRYWLDNPHRVHVIGKGIIRFHAVYWPAMLLSARVPLPTTIFVHGYVTIEGGKISKSLGNVIDPVELAERYGTDALRYYLLRAIPSTDDGDFSLDRFIRTYNVDLADQLGNLLNRVVSNGSSWRER